MAGLGDDDAQRSGAVGPHLEAAVGAGAGGDLGGKIAAVGAGAATDDGDVGAGERLARAALTQHPTHHDPTDAQRGGRAEERVVPVSGGAGDRTTWGWKWITYSIRIGAGLPSTSAGRTIHLARRGHRRLVEAVAGRARDRHGRDAPRGVQRQQQRHLARQPGRERLGGVDRLHGLRDGGRLGQLRRRRLGLPGGRRRQRRSSWAAARSATPPSAQASATAPAANREIGRGGGERRKVPAKFTPAPPRRKARARAMRDTRRMAGPLPRLRTDLDVMPSPIPEQPGLLVRDPFRYSDATLIVPPLLARCLSYFDGAHDQDDLRARLASLTGTIKVADVAKQLVTALSEAGFLEDDRFAALREAREQAFAAGDERVPAHAGSGYPDEPAALRARLDGYHAAAPGQKAKATRPKVESRKATVGIAAPHVSPEGGCAATPPPTARCPPKRGDRTFVVLGTSHYGEPDRFGLTRKPFSTPFGRGADRSTASSTAGGRGAGPRSPSRTTATRSSTRSSSRWCSCSTATVPTVRIVPVLCGAVLGRAAGRAPRPRTDERVDRFIDALGELAAREGRRLMFVLGVDFAHVGRRYGDTHPARAYEGHWPRCRPATRPASTRIAAGDAEGFWDLVDERGDDDLKWCGSSPLYTFLRAVPEVGAARSLTSSGTSTRRASSASAPSLFRDPDRDSAIRRQKVLTGCAREGSDCRGSGDGGLEPSRMPYPNFHATPLIASLVVALTAVTSACGLMSKPERAGAAGNSAGGGSRRRRWGQLGPGR